MTSHVPVLWLMLVSVAGVTSSPFLPATFLTPPTQCPEASSDCTRHPPETHHIRGQPEAGARSPQNPGLPIGLTCPQSGDFLRARPGLLLPFCTLAQGRVHSSNSTKLLRLRSQESGIQSDSSPEKPEIACEKAWGREGTGQEEEKNLISASWMGRNRHSDASSSVGPPHCDSANETWRILGSKVSGAAAAAKSLQSCATVWPHRQQPTRLPCPWDSPGKNTGVGCHFLLQWRKVKSESEVSQSCPALNDPMDCSLPGSSVHGIFQARVLEWGAIAPSKSLGGQGCFASFLWSSCQLSTSLVIQLCACELLYSHHPQPDEGSLGPWPTKVISPLETNLSNSEPLIGPCQPGERLALDQVPTLIQSAICKGASLAAQGNEWTVLCPSGSWGTTGFPAASTTEWFAEEIELRRALKSGPSVNSVQFSSVTQLCPTLCNPMDCSTPGFPVHHQLLELTRRGPLEKGKHGKPLQYSCLENPTNSIKRQV